ncbi:MAG TPA: hypothetical protein DCP08_00755 [Chloroflexi bacterium]|nr:hypothetical protein [Chloroflexota bacterium]
MEIEHKLGGTQVEYGYIWWKTKENDKYRQILPEGDFTVDLQGQKIAGRKVDWKQGRVYIGKKPMQELFQKDDVVIISKSSDGKAVIVRKKEGYEPPPPDLVSKLRDSQRNTDDPTSFEKALVEAFQYLGFSAEHIGGRDEPDILINDDFKIILDSKTTKEGVITERYINFNALDRYKEKYKANHLGVVAPGFSEGYVRETAKKRGVILIETEAICKLLENHAVYPYEPTRVVEILFKSSKWVISTMDIPPSTIDQERLIEITAKILSDIRSTGKQSFTSRELHIAYQWQGLNYEVDDIEN